MPLTHRGREYTPWPVGNMGMVANCPACGMTNLAGGLRIASSVTYYRNGRVEKARRVSCLGCGHAGACGATAEAAVALWNEAAGVPAHGAEAAAR